MDFTNIEKKWQKIWEESKIFEADPNDKKKIFITVAYPYPSGAMHVGHGRTYTVPDVYARFKRMQGYNVLFPMAWHVTGAPVVGIAKRIERKDPWTLKTYKEVHKVPEDELKKFSDPHYIVEYFSKEYKKIMKKMGYSIDWRREFKTTDPHYQKFIEWQMKKLKEMGLIRKGTHPVKYCPECQNPVGDHDLLEGEGVDIVELTLLKFKIDDSYLVAATFRPETIFGTTNIWLNPDSKYIKVKVGNEKWIISKESYENISHQKDIEILEDVNPKELIGKHVKNPITKKDHPILPAEFVDPKFGTGVVFSVPAHAPADYVALRDLKNNDDIIAEYKLDKEMLASIKPVPVIEVEGFGELPAKDIVDKLNVKDQNDPKLEKATNEIYKVEHNKGIMKVEEYDGIPVSEAREKIIERLCKEGKADKLYEFSEIPVICRCGANCVVKIMKDQWFLKYSNEEWKNKALSCLNQMKIVPDEIRQNIEYFIKWLKDWACARKIGLGTKLPWDKRWIVEPLTDSTIYMAYYTIAHKIKEKDPEELNSEYFDEVFLNNPDEEFAYWYPLDWRLSAKDLIGNHLTFHIFHHSAIFPEDKWPKGIVVFGMGLLEGQKMSSSKGNIVTLSEAISEYGADVVRMFLMSSAEPWQDFDWRKKEVIGVKRRIEQFFELYEKIDEKIGLNFENKLEIRPKKFINKWILSQVNQRIKNVTEALEKFQTRKALQEGFFLFRKDVDHYLKRVKPWIELEETKEILRYVMKVWVKLVAPFIPHIAEEIWEKYGGNGLISVSKWPEPKEEFIDKKIQKSEEIVEEVIKDIKEIKKIIRKKPEKVHIYISPKWKYKIYDMISSSDRKDLGTIIPKALSEIEGDKKEIVNFIKKSISEIAKKEYVGYIDEYKVFKEAKDYIEEEVNAKIVIHKKPDYDPKNKSKMAEPYKPAIYIE